jgi:hypothetical protein
MAKALPNLEGLPASPSLAQTLRSDAVLDALKVILLGCTAERSTDGYHPPHPRLVSRDYPTGSNCNGFWKG